MNKSDGRIRINQDLACVLLIVMFCCIFFYKPLFTRTVRLQWDALDLHYPALLHTSRSFHENRLPLWEPYLFCGYPFIGYIQAGSYYPVNFFLALFREITPVLVQYITVLHFCIAGLGMFWLGRTIGLGTIASSVSSIGFAFSGQLLGHATHIGILEQIALLPLILVLISAGWEKSRWEFFVFAGTVCGFGALAGHFQSTLYCIFLAILWLIFEPFVTASERIRLRTLLRVVSMAMLLVISAALITGIQLFSTAQLATQSVRSGISYDLASSESFFPKSLATLLFPNCYGGIRGDYWGSWSRTNQQCYIGVCTLIFFLCGFTRKMSRRDYFLIGFTIFGFLFSLGEKTFVHKLILNVIPGWNLVRTPAAMLPLVFVMLGLMAGKGCDHFIQSNHRDSSRRLLYFCLGIFLVGSVTGYFIHQTGGTFPDLYSIEKLSRDIVEWLVVFLLTASILLGISIVKLQRKAFLWVIPLSLFVDISVAYRQSDLMFGIGHPYADLQTTPERAFLDAQYEKDRTFRIHDWKIRQLLLPNEGSIRHYMTILGRISGLHPHHIGELVRLSEFNRQILDLLRVRFVLMLDTEEKPIVTSTISRNLDWKPWRAEEVFIPAGKNILENDRWFPVIFPIQNWIIEEENARTLELLMEMDLRTTGILSRDPGISPGNPGESKIVLQDYQPHGIRFDCTLTRDTVLIITDTFYPGWIAQVDSKTVDIMKADHALRAIVVPSGFHSVTMTFRPACVKPGVFGTLLGFLALCMAATSWILGKKHHQGS